MTCFGLFWRVFEILGIEKVTITIEAIITLSDKASKLQTYFHLCDTAWADLWETLVTRARSTLGG